MSQKSTPASTPAVSWWSITTCGIAASLYRRPVCGCESTITTAVSGSSDTLSTGTSGIGIKSTIARFSERAIMPSTVRMTGLPGSQNPAATKLPACSQASLVGVHVRNQHDATIGRERGQQLVARGAVRVLGILRRSNVFEIGRHDRLDHQVRTPRRDHLSSKSHSTCLFFRLYANGLALARVCQITVARSATVTFRPAPGREGAFSRNTTRSLAPSLHRPAGQASRSRPNHPVWGAENRISPRHPR